MRAPPRRPRRRVGPRAGPRRARDRGRVVRPAQSAPRAPRGCRHTPAL